MQKRPDHSSETKSCWSGPFQPTGQALITTYFLTISGLSTFVLLGLLKNRFLLRKALYIFSLVLINT